MLKHILFLQIVFITIFGYSQSPVSINYDASKGLKSDVSYVIFSDSRGLIWAAPEGAGVAYFDGSGQNGFRHFTQKDGLCGNTIMGIGEDKNGNMWFGSQGYGISMFDGKKFTNYSVKDSVGLTNDISPAFLQHSNGDFFVSVYNGGLMRFRNGFFEPIGDSTFSSITIWTMLEDKDGVVWCSTHGHGLVKFDGTKMEFMNESLGIPVSIGLDLAFDLNGDLILGTGTGPVRIRDNKVITVYNESHGLLPGATRNSIRCIYTKKNGDILLGYWNRIWILRGEKVLSVPLNGDLQKAPARFIEDKNGKVWYTTSSGGIVQLLDNGIEVISSPKAERDLAALTYGDDNVLYGALTNGIYRESNGTFYQLGKDFYGTLSDVQGVIVRDTNNIFLLSSAHGINHLKRENEFDLNQVGTWGMYDYERISDSLVLVLGKGSVYTFNLYTYETIFTFDFYQDNGEYGVIYSMQRDLNNNIWLGRYDDGAIIKITSTDTIQYNSENGLPDGAIVDLQLDNEGDLWFLTTDGHLGYEKDGHFTWFPSLVETTAGAFTFDKNGNVWIGNAYGVLFLEIKNDLIISSRQFNKYDGIDETETPDKKIQLTPDNRILVTKNSTNAYFIDPDKIIANDEKPLLLISDITGKDNATLDSSWYSKTSGFFHTPEDLILPYKNNNLTITLKTIYFSQPDSIRYSYQLIGSDENWSKPQYTKSIVFTNLPAGEYTLNCKAIGVNQNESEIVSFQFTIQTPWFQTWWFYTLTVLFILIAIYLFVKWRLLVLQKDKDRLEHIVETRTREVVLEKEIVQEKNREIMDSITYAKRIQAAILPSYKLVKEYLEDSFILYVPKDIVAGDFYWLETIQNTADPKSETILFAAADCTGHGVPGAMVSVVCNNALNRSVREYGLGKPGDILNKTREIVISEFEKSEEEVKDGMDISLCALNLNNLELEWAGANNPLWIVQTRGGKTELLEVKADKQPIGKFANSTPFATHHFQLEKNDVIYIFTDGYQDQFGGDKGKKFKASNLKQLILSLAHLPLEKQGDELAKVINDWRGNLEQIDDICVIGVRV
jgi:serine phosphatase RsbU (regulator of sigma subunit)/ligand-binding sensor domain-containing protein